jgi:SAM-dependent methyltransferase
MRGPSAGACACSIPVWVEADIANEPRFADCRAQIQLYAELYKAAQLDAEAWRCSAVLEIGAASGGGLLNLNSRYWPKSASGIDFSRLAVWRGRNLGIDLRRGDALALPFEDKVFDCVICVDTLQLLPSGPFIAEAARVMKPGASMLLGIHEPRSVFDKRYGDLGADEGLTIERIIDATQGVRQSVIDMGADEKAFAKL